MFFLLLLPVPLAAGGGDPDLSETLDSLQAAPHTARTARAYNALGKKYRERSAYYKAVECHKAALAIAENIGDRPAIIESLNSMGVAYRRLDESYMAMEAHMQALQMAEQDGDLRHIAYSLNSIGNIHIAVHDYRDAVVYLHRALAIETARNNPLGRAMNLNNIGEAWFLEGVADSAEYYYNLSLEVNEQIGRQMGVAINYNSLGALYKQRGELDRAIDLFHRAERINLNIDDKIHLGATYNYLGEAYASAGDFPTALFHYGKGLDINEAIGSKWNLCVTYTGLSDLYRRMGDYAKALDCYTKYSDLNAEMIDERNKRFVEEMQAKYETSEKESLIASLTAGQSRNRIAIWSISAFTVLLIISVLFVVNGLRQKRRIAEQRLVDIEQRRRIDASRSLIEGEIGERARLARELHDGLGNMLSVAKYNLRRNNSADFHAAEEMLDDSIRELRRIAHSLMPQSLMKYGLKVALEDYCNSIPSAQFHFYGEEKRLDQQLEIIVYRIAQELAGNAMKHSCASQINVQLFLETGRLCLYVQDDGCGFDPAAQSAGMGLTNIRNRTATRNGRLNIGSSPGHGTEISVEFDI